MTKNDHFETQKCHFQRFWLLSTILFSSLQHPRYNVITVWLCIGVVLGWLWLGGPFRIDFPVANGKIELSKGLKLPMPDRPGGLRLGMVVAVGRMDTAGGNICPICPLLTEPTFWGCGGLSRLSDGAFELWNGSKWANWGIDSRRDCSWYVLELFCDNTVRSDCNSEFVWWTLPSRRVLFDWSAKSVGLIDSWSPGWLRGLTGTDDGGGVGSGMEGGASGVAGRDAHFMSRSNSGSASVVIGWLAVALHSNSSSSSSSDVSHESFTSSSGGLSTSSSSIHSFFRFALVVAAVVVGRGCDGCVCCECDGGGVAAAFLFFVAFLDFSTPFWFVAMGGVVLELTLFWRFGSWLCLAEAAAIALAVKLWDWIADAIVTGDADDEDDDEVVLVPPNAVLEAVEFLRFVPPLFWVASSRNRLSLSAWAFASNRSYNTKWSEMRKIKDEPKIEK